MRYGLILAYVCAGSGLVVRVVLAGSGAERLMAIALLLFTTDLARMAIVDLSNLNSVRKQMGFNPEAAPRLAGFGYCLAVTIVLELLGLLASWRWVGAGVAIVMVSQLFFNLFVKISVSTVSVSKISVSAIDSDRTLAQPSIRSWPIVERLDVLLADTIALGLTVLWIVTNRPLGIAVAILAMIIIYLAIKYIPGKQVNHG
ncbi:MAG: hypothetical protein AAF268_00420 [Cyanobacteria bacterium P01_A01_bin.3]